ncbi:hypothetical protein EBR21_08525, partial [bacterium]|nr:hypothetical protein [bacterium]
MDNSNPFYADLVTQLKAAFPGIELNFEERSEKRHEQTISVGKEQIVAIMEALKSKFGFDFLMDVCGVDWPGREKRFDVVYHLFNKNLNRRLRVKSAVGEGESIPTVTTVWAGANWFEREAFDMFGIKFEGHPDLRR